ncbi:MAG: DUF853 family protein [Firmicutes bacterium]|nr:DUF853 family protein [Bacillota bacterium]
MIDNNQIYFARKGSEAGLGDKLYLNPKMANRHGFICGATGTGKTVTLKVLAESFSAIGTPVFVADVKGDVVGLSQPGADNEKMQERIARFEIGDTFKYQGYPVHLFDVFGEKGIPLRTTISEMGPQLLSQILELNETQSSLLSVVFQIADDNGLLIHDIKDLKAVLQFVTDNAADYETDYGHIAKASVTTIIRSIVALEGEGANAFFGDPAIDINDFVATTEDGRGVINILSSESLINKPKLYSAFMLYLLSELFEVMPEVGNLDKPKIVFIFDEAHLLFNNAPKALQDKIEQVIKLIRSKGIGIYFVTQNPSDIPDAVLSQLGNKIEHALRAFTPGEQKGLKAAANAFRTNPEFDTLELLQNLGTGEAVVSLLDEKGIPGISEHAYILPPESLMASITDGDREALIKSCPLNEKYAETIDPESAYEVLAAAKEEKAEAEEKAAKKTEVAKKSEKKSGKSGSSVTKKETKKKSTISKETEKVFRTASGTIGREIGKSVGEKVLGKKGKTLGGNVGAQIARSLLGTIMKR